MSDDTGRRSRATLITAAVAAPVVLGAVAVGLDALRPLSPRFLYSSAFLLWPGWVLSLLLRRDPFPLSAAALAALSIPYWFVLSALAVCSRARSRRISIPAGILSVLLLLAQVVVGTFMARMAFAFTYEKLNVIAR